jgi:hypothetical protein
MVTREEVNQIDPHHRLTVTRRPMGWEVREERDREVVRTTTYRDWHRVERAVQTFDRLYSTNR